MGDKEREYEYVIGKAIEALKKKGFRIVKLIDEGRDTDEYADPYGPNLFSIEKEL